MSIVPRPHRPDRTAGRLLRWLPSLPAFRGNLWKFLIGIFLVFVGIGIQSVILNLYLVGIGYRADFLGLFAFVNTGAIGGSALLAGPISRRIGLRRVLISAVIVLTVSVAGLALTRHPVTLLAIAVLSGLAQAGIFVPSGPFLMDNARPRQRSSAFAAYFAAQALASTVGSLLGGALPQVLSGSGEATTQGYIRTLVVAAVLTGFAFLPLTRADDSQEAESSVSLVSPAEPVIKRRRVQRDLAWQVVANAFVAVSTGFAIPFLNVFFDQQLGASTATIGLIFAFGSGAMTVASLLGPSAGRRFGTVRAVVVCRLVCVPLLVMLGLAQDVWAGAALYVVRTLFFNLTWPVDNSFAMELVPAEMRATLAALRSTSWNIAWSLASGVAGVMIVTFGFRAVFLSSATFLVVGCASYFLAFRSREPATRHVDARVSST